MKNKRFIKLGLLLVVLFLGVITISVSATVVELIYEGEQNLDDIELIVYQLVNDVNTLYSENQLLESENTTLQEEILRLNDELVEANQDIENTISNICIEIENLPPPFQTNYDTYCN